MMPRGDLRVKFASFGKPSHLKQPIGRIISDWLGCGAACPKPANSLLAVASEWSRRESSDIEHVASEGMERLGKAT
jgi:hypothetical protein